MSDQTQDKQQQDAGDGGTTGAEPRETTQAPDGQGQETTQTQPHAIFPTAEALNARLDRARQQGVSQLLEELGLGDAGALKALVTAHREREDAEKSEAEKLQGKLDKALEDAGTLKAERDRLAAQLKQEREDRLVERLAGDLGFADVTDAASLVDRARFEYGDEDQVKADSVKAALEALLEAKPHLRGQAKPAPRIDAQAGTGKGPAEPQSSKDYSAHLPARLRPRQAAGVARPQQ